MTIAYWCVFVAGLLPYIFTVLAKTGVGYTNRRPREYLEQVQGWRKRAHCTQLNGFEAFPFFAAAVIIAQRTFVHQNTLDILALLFIVARILYGIFYITDKATLRTIAWGIGFGCCVGLFLVSARG